MPIEYWQPMHPRAVARVAIETLEVLRPLARRQPAARWGAFGDDRRPGIFGDVAGGLRNIEH